MDLTCRVAVCDITKGCQYILHKKKMEPAKEPQSRIHYMDEVNMTSSVAKRFPLQQHSLVNYCSSVVTGSYEAAAK